jgi:hydroxymethylpyrimidine/phosphomethylpyrimidine kinase
MTATTALTAQNTMGVEDIHITPPAFVAKQIDLCLSDIGCDAVKIGEVYQNCSEQEIQYANQ